MSLTMARLCLAPLLFTALFHTTLYAAVPADRIFPDSTKGFVTVINLADFAEQLDRTQFGRLLNDPLMRNFKRQVQSLLTERLEQAFGFSPADISTFPSGEAALGMIAPPGQLPGYVLVINVADQKTETERYIAGLTQRFVNAGTAKTTETYKEQPITILTFPASGTPLAVRSPRIEITIEPTERTAHYMLFQDWLIASDQLHLLKLIVDRIAESDSSEPSGKALADVEAYQTVMRRCLSDLPEGISPAVRWYVDPLGYGESLRHLLRGSLAQNRRDKPTIVSILRQQGFDALQGIGGVITVKTEEQEVVYRTFIYTKKPYRLAMRMLAFPDGTDFTPPVWMPADLARCTMFYVDPAAVFDNIGVLADAFLGEEGVWDDIMRGLETDPNGPQINIREELIAHLGTRILGMSRYEKPITTESESLVVAIEQKEGRQQAMLAGMEKLFGTDPEMTFTQYNGHKIWHRKPTEDVWEPIDLDIPDIFQQPPGPQQSSGSGFPPSLVDTPPSAGALQDEDDLPPVFPHGGVVVAKGSLIVATNIEYLTVILDRLDNTQESARSTIGNEAEYKAVNSIFAGLGITDKPHFFQFFARTHETFRPTYEMIRQDKMAQSQAIAGKLLNAVLSPDGETGVRRQVLDGSTMPEFEKIEHYFGKIGIYGATQPDGYFIKGFSADR